MKTIFKLAGLFVLLLAFSCQNESLSDPNSDLQQASKSANAKKVTKQITNALESDDDLNSTAECGGAFFYGTMSHMGKVSGYTENKTCDWPDDFTLHLTSYDVTRAANGDEMWGEGDIILHIPTDGSTIATIEGGSIITGGTGRFEGATGWFVYENMVYDFVTGHESHTAYGEITY